MVYCSVQCKIEYARGKRVTISPLRTCLQCKKDQPIGMFKRGNSFCSPTCSRQHQKDLSKIKHATKVHTPLSKLKVYQTGAKVRGIEFDLSLQVFSSYWQKPCYYCGTSIKTIGLDRKDSSLGYIESNIVPCCTLCNTTKNSQAHDEFINRCRLIASRFPV